MPIVFEGVAVGRFGEWWVARAPWSAVTVQGATAEQAVERMREALALRGAGPVPTEQFVAPVPVEREASVFEQVEAAGWEVQRVLERAGFVVADRSRHHVLVCDERTGARVVVPLETPLAAQAMEEVVRQAGLRAAEVRALL